MAAVTEGLTLPAERRCPDWHRRFFHSHPPRCQHVARLAWGIKTIVTQRFSGLGAVLRDGKKQWRRLRSHMLAPTKLSLLLAIGHQLEVSRAGRGPTERVCFRRGLCETMKRGKLSSRHICQESSTRCTLSPQVDLPPFTWDCRKLRTIGLSLQRRHGGRHMTTGTSSSRPQQKPALTTGRWQWRR